MTLIVAIACKDGVVIAADSCMTVGFGGIPVTQDTNKLFVIGKSAIAGAAGSVNMIDEVGKVLQKHKTDLDRGLDAESKHDILFEIAKEVTEQMKLHYFTTPMGGAGGERGFGGGIFFIGVRDEDKALKVWYINAAEGMSSGFLERSGHSATGSGGAFAYGFLHGYDTKNMDLEHAIVRAYGTIKETIETGAPGVGGRIDVCVLDKNGVARQLTTNEVETYANAYSYLKKKMLTAEEENWSEVKKHLKSGTIKPVASASTTSQPLETVNADLLRGKEVKSSVPMRDTAAKDRSPVRMKARSTI